ncbi:Ldh family oxidoreductase [Castellaniella sp.]|uniref:Ldh family oxidoreductase n=1 Tax=Castellaniella sp. TaxID=1955812 RepID=UPI00356ACAF8
MTQARFSADALRTFAADLLQAAGTPPDMARDVADVLVLGDLLGHDTHGLALLGPYLDEIHAGHMNLAGPAQVVSDRPAALCWDGRRLPGPWLVREGMRALMPRARELGSASLVIRRSHHIACLAAYLLEATEHGLMMILASSDPNGGSVAPFGGTRGIFTPNPIAAGIPASDGPFLIDISASLVTNGLSGRLYKEGRSFGYDCLLDAQGQPSRDPAVLFTDPPGSILPLGGLQAGHKGFALAVLIEALTGGLAGHGRADPPEGWGATVYLTLLDPDAFGGLAGFIRQTDWLADACRSNPPRPGVEAVRMPGDRGLALKRQQEQDGLQLHPSIAPQLAEKGRQHGVAFPSPLPARGH